MIVSKKNLAAGVRIESYGKAAGVFRSAFEV